MKQCRKCGEKKEIEQFPFFASSTGGRKNTCTVCCKELSVLRKKLKEKNPLGCVNVTNHFLNTFSEDYLLIMDASTTFTSDPIPQTLKSLEAGYQGVGWKGGLINLEDEWRTTTDKGAGEVDVLFGYYFALDRKFAISAGGANPSAKYYRNADLELSLAIRDAGGKLLQIDLPLSQGRHHGYHDVDPDYRDKNSRKNYQRILDRFRGKNEILSPRR